MSGGLGVDNTSRRKFRDEYAKRKLEEDIAKVRRLQEEAENPDKKRKLNPPPAIDYKSQVGKTTICASPDVGFTCEVCNVTKKDHLSLLDHLNSQEHIKAVGQEESANTTKKVTALDIRNKLSKFKAVEQPAPSKKKKNKKAKDDDK